MDDDSPLATRDEQQPARRSTPAARRWLFRAIALLIGFSPLWGGEVLLRAIGWTPDAARDPFVGFQNVTPLFQVEGNFRVTASERLEFFAPERFAVAKPADEFRVFCLGGSTVQGRPWSIETSFTTWLELSLRCADESRRYEVVNCGGVSYASYRLVPLLQECLAYEPDLIVIYTGHNEFLEDRSYPSQRRWAPWVASPYAQLSKLRVVQWAQERQSAPPLDSNLLTTEVDALLDYRGGLDSYHRDQDWRRGVEEHFEVNLRRMVALSRASKVPVILVDPVSNERDCPPFKVETAPQLDHETAAAFEYDWRRLRAGSADHPRELLETALTRDPQHAGALFMAAALRHADGDWEEAKRLFRQAQNADVCPLRMTEPLHERLRRVAIDTETPLAEVRAAFGEKARDGIPGDELLVDHVHPNLEGHQLVAQLLLEQMVRMELLTPSDEWEQRRQAAYADHLGDLDEVYFNRGKQRLEGLRRWAAGRAYKVK